MVWKDEEKDIEKSENWEIERLENWDIEKLGDMEIWEMRFRGFEIEIVEDIGRNVGERKRKGND